MSSSTDSCHLIIAGGAVVDGTGAPKRTADVAVKEGRIAAVGDLSRWSADTTLDAQGLVVAPGFIDMHSHSDLALLLNPRAESKLRQGVTTEVIGQCGSSPAPSPLAQRDTIRELWGWMGREVDWTWESFGEFLDALRSKRASVNVVPLVGHSILRAGLVGQSDRPATPSELSAMQEAVRAALEQGAFGLSTGLVYAPGLFADTGEIIALAQAAAPLGGLYFSHIRGEGDTLLEAVAEAITIGREAGLPVQIAHMKAEGRANWGRTEAALAAIDAARESGDVDVTFDVYPYTAWNTGLSQLLPTWAREGGPEALVLRLRDPGARARIRRHIADEAAADPGRWDRRLLGSVVTETNQPLQGMTLAQIADQRHLAAEDVAMDLLVEEQGKVGMVGFGMCEEDVSRVIAHPSAIIGSDAAAAAPYGVLGRSHPHPRAYGTFPRVLGHYVRDQQLLSLEEAVAKMTSRPAHKLRLTDRGQLAPGLAADIVVFDPTTISDTAAYEAPHQYPTGIRWVIVNGLLELDGDTHQGRRPGRVLERPTS